MVINMECRAFMASLPANSFDSIVTDPPYGLSKQPNMREVLKHWLNGDDYTASGGGFMGKSWDSFVPGPKTWEQAFRVLKPGGYAVVFAGSRTVDLMATSLRLAGFEVVDMLHWLYGSGFPKSMDIGKAIDAQDAVAERRARQDRDEGLEDFALATAGEMTGGRAEGSDGLNSPRSGAGRTGGARNVHPTVKPTAVMRWLVRLVTPPGGIPFDPFCGSGSTLKAAALEGFNAVGCEMDPQYAAIARAREEAARCKKQST